MPLGFVQSIRIFRNAVGLDLPPSGDLPEMPLDLGRRRDDDRRRAALDERLDRRHDAVQKFEQFFLANPGPVVEAGVVGADREQPE